MLSTTYVLSSLFIALTASVAHAQSADGRLASFHADDASAGGYTLHIVKLGKTPMTISKTKIAYAGEETWLDAKTLAVVSVDTENKKYKLQYFVDGVVDAKRTLDGTLAFTVPKKAEFPSITDAYRGAKGELFLRGCVAQDGNEECSKYAWTRIDAGKPGALKAAPKGAVPFHQGHAKDPKAKAPKDITVKLTKVASTFEPKKKKTAVQCKSAAKTSTFFDESPSMEASGEQFTPKTIAWLSAEPAIYSVTGPHFNPVGWKTTATYYFRACEEQFIGNFQWHGDDLWSEWSVVEPVSDIKVYVGKDKLATFKGDSFAVAPL